MHWCISAFFNLPLQRKRNHRSLSNLALACYFGSMRFENMLPIAMPSVFCPFSF